jgi:hypothetical protein
MTFPKHLTWEKCNCGHASCTYRYPTNLGSFYQGTGFAEKEAEELNRRWELGND